MVIIFNVKKAELAHKRKIVNELFSRFFLWYSHMVIEKRMHKAQIMISHTDVGMPPVTSI